jgi:7-cyano-7-deazaguanine reductase
MDDDAVADELTLLGRPHTGPVEHVETFPAPEGCTKVVFTTDEVTSLCPVTRQPDISSVRIEYVPDQRCIESKSLKLFLWGFRDEHVFAEALAVRIADEVWETVRPRSVDVVVTQHVRGGIVTETHSSHPRS